MITLVFFVHVPFPLFTMQPSCRPVVIYPSSRSSLQMSARVAAIVVADCFDESLRYYTRLYAATPGCCSIAAPVKCQVTCQRKV